MDPLARRTATISAFGPSAFEVEELLLYDQNLFQPERIAAGIDLPLESERHLPVWEEYAAAVTAASSIEPLRSKLVPLRFPVRLGISTEADYQAATRRGIDPDTPDEPLPIRGPVRLIIHHHPAGSLPAFIAAERDDFIALLRAFGHNNEPVSVPGYQGSVTISGFNNWDRVRRHRQAWEQATPEATDDAWRAEFKRLVPDRWRYQDRFLIVSEDPYCGAPADKLGFSEPEWRQKSAAIRLEHKSAEYFAQRVFGMRQDRRIHDDLIADWAGMRAVFGRFRADRFLRFMGLPGFSDHGPGGRIERYSISHFELSDGGLRILQELTILAATSVERFWESAYDDGSPRALAVGLVTLASLSLIDMASEDGVDLIREAHDRAQAIVRWQNT